MIQDFHGQMGRTVFNVDMNYYLGEDESIRKRDNYLGLKANYIDVDQLSNFNLDSPEQKESTKQIESTDDVAKHAESFNIYELPFTDMKFDVDIAHLIKDRIDIKNIRNIDMLRLYTNVPFLLSLDSTLHVAHPHHIHFLLALCTCLMV